jgi:hypothetical protein
MVKIIQNEKRLNAFNSNLAKKKDKNTIFNLFQSILLNYL